MTDAYDSGYADFWNQYMQGNPDILNMIHSQIESAHIKADKITVGANSSFEPNYDPSTKETTTGSQDKADAALQAAKDYRDQWAKAGTTEIDGANIFTGSITASAISVNSLDAISANLGTVTAGSLTSNTTIDVNTDLYVGNSIYLGSNFSNTTKSLIFTGYARINTDGDFGLWVSSSTFRVDGSSTFQNNLAITGTSHLDFSTYGGGWYMQDTTWIRAVGNKNIYTPGTVKATTFDNTSLSDYKENITQFTDYALDSIASTKVYRYNYKKEYAPTNWQVRKTGFLYDEIHPYLQSGEDAIDLYGITAFLWKGEQELYKAIKDLQTRVATLEGSAA